MDLINSLTQFLLHPTDLINAVGLIGIFIIIFAESGLLVGFFLPGDSLLFTAGFLASQGSPNIFLLVLISVVAAITGDSVGYSFGHKVGRRLFQKENSRFFKKEYLIKAEDFYKKHGGKAIILARFTPFIRTFVPIVAGTAQMDYQKFLTYNVVGGVLWGAGVSIAGYFLGRVIPDVDKYLLPIVALIILISVFPSVLHVIRERRK